MPREGNELVNTYTAFKIEAGYGKCSVSPCYRISLNSLIPISLHEASLDLTFLSVYTLHAAQLLQRLTFSLCLY